MHPRDTSNVKPHALRKRVIDYYCSAVAKIGRRKRNKTCKIPNLSQLNRQIIILCIQAMTLTLERICEGLTKFQRRFHLEISNDCREFLFCGNNKPITGTWRKRQEVWFGLIGVNLLMGKTAWGSCWKRSNMLSDFHYPYVYSMHTRA